MFLRLCQLVAATAPSVESLSSMDHDSYLQITKPAFLSRFSGSGLGGVVKTSPKRDGRRAIRPGSTYKCLGCYDYIHIT